MKKLIVLMMAFLLLIVTSPMTFANSEAATTKVTATKEVVKNVPTVEKTAIPMEATSVEAATLPDSNGKNETQITKAETDNTGEIDTKAEGGYTDIFSTFAALVAIIPFIIQFFRKLIPNASSLTVQIFSWLIGIAVTMFGWIFHLGFLQGMDWWLALLYGFGVSLAANGVFDTGVIEWILKLFKIQPIVRSKK